jgi:hypothetical protein
MLRNRNDIAIAIGAADLVVRRGFPVVSQIEMLSEGFSVRKETVELRDTKVDKVSSRFSRMAL